MIHGLTTEVVSTVSSEVTVDHHILAGKSAVVTRDSMSDDPTRDIIHEMRVKAATPRFVQ